MEDCTEKEKLRVGATTQHSTNRARPVLRQPPTSPLIFSVFDSLVDAPVRFVAEHLQLAQPQGLLLAPHAQVHVTHVLRCHPVARASAVAESGPEVRAVTHVLEAIPQPAKKTKNTRVVGSSRTWGWHDARTAASVGGGRYSLRYSRGHKRSERWHVIAQRRPWLPPHVPGPRDAARACFAGSWSCC